MALLEHLYSVPVAQGKQFEFIGICNELNAAYAADGYSKVIDGLSVLITTYGVGELSAINGIAGAFTEYSPVLHIVGTTLTKQINQAKSASAKDVVNIHHLVQNKNPLSPPDHDVYKRAVEDFSVAQETLDSDNALENLARIDRVISAILKENRPGYLFIPADMPDTLVPRWGLQVPFDTEELANEALLDELSARILTKLYTAEKPSIIGDALVTRFKARKPFTQFIESMPTNFVKLFTTSMARNIRESLPNFVGVYQGKLSPDDRIRQSLELNTDFLLSLGTCNNEINLGSYSADLSNIKDYVEVHPDYVLIDGEYIPVKNDTRAFSIVDMMTRLALGFSASKLMHNDGSNHIDFKYVPPQFSVNDTCDEQIITQNKLADFFNAYLQPNDIFMVETCSFLFGVLDLRLPDGVDFYSQSLYGSIGYALPATLGLARAEHDLGTNRRIVLVQGDGSAQMTIQELSSYLRYDIQPPKIFLLNNEGYTVERLIRGPTRSYNDIQATWKWREFFKIFGDAKEEKHVSTLIDTTDKLVEKLEGGDVGKIEMNELRLTKLDVPARFKSMFK